jgi:hypothetical protein
MLAKILKLLIFFVFFLTLTILFNLQESKITLELNNYILYTSLFKAISLILIIYIPYRFIRFIVKQITNKIHSLSYARNLIRLLNTNKLLPNNNLSLEVLNANLSIKEIKHLRSFIEIINNKDIVKAGLLFNHKQVKDKIKSLYLKYLVELALNINDTSSFKSYSKMGLLLEENDWFFYNLCVYYIKNNLTIDLIELEKIKNKINKTNNIYYEQSLCLLAYTLGKHYKNKGELELARQILEDIIKKYANFLPAYELLLEINYHNNKEVNKLLLKLWQNNKSYNAIELFVNYYREASYSNLVQDLVDIFKDSKNENNLLLACALNIKFSKFLEANELLYKVDDSNITKHTIAIDLLQKEHKIDYLRFNLKALFDNVLAQQNWWHNTV